MKTIPLILLAFLFFHADGQMPLRHFAQASSSTSDETQYCNNPQAGHYAKSGDARIYYEVYGKGNHSGCRNTGTKWRNSVIP